jgi:hypothetical protein
MKQYIPDTAGVKHAASIYEGYGDKAKLLYDDESVIECAPLIEDYTMLEAWLAHVRRPVTMTIFPDQYAHSMEVEALSLEGLAKRVVAVRRSTKKMLPYVKLATFNGVFNPQNTETGSLRYDAGVVEIHGVEGDKDSAPLTFDEAVEKLEAANLLTLIYASASPNHFRVICPTSKPLLPAERRELMGVLNGVLGGALSRESFTPSQAYYYGQVIGKPAPRVRIVAGGRCIDQCHDFQPIYEGWKKEKTESNNTDLSGGTSNTFINYGEVHIYKEPIDIDQALADMEYKGDGNGVHLTQLRVAASLLSRGQSADEVIERLLAETRRVAERDDHGGAWSWPDETKKLDSLCATWVKKKPELQATAYPAERPTANVKPATTSVASVDQWSNIEPINLWATGMGPALPKGLLPKVIEDLAFEHGALTLLDWQ